MDHSPPVEPRLTFNVIAARNGRKFRIIVKEKDRAVVRISNIKKNLAAVARIPVEQQILEKDGVVLDDRTTGSEFGLGPDTILTLRIVGEERDNNFQKTIQNTTPSLPQGSSNCSNRPEHHTAPQRSASRPSQINLGPATIPPNSVSSNPPTSTNNNNDNNNGEPAVGLNMSSLSGPIPATPNTRLSEALARGILLAAVKYERQRKEKNGLEATEAELMERTKRTGTAIEQAWRNILSLSGEHTKGLEIVGEAISRYQDLEYQLSNPNALTVFLGMRTDSDGGFNNNGAPSSIPVAIEKLKILVSQMEAEKTNLEQQLAQEARRRRKLRVQFEEILGMTRIYLRLFSNSSRGDARVIIRDQTSCNVLARTNQRVTVQFDKIFSDDASLISELASLSVTTLEGYSLITAVTGNKILECLGTGAFIGSIVGHLLQTTRKEQMNIVIETSALTVAESSVVDLVSMTEVSVCNGIPIGINWSLCLDEDEAVTSFTKMLRAFKESDQEFAFVIRLTRMGNGGNNINNNGNNNSNNTVMHNYIYFVFNESIAHANDMAVLSRADGTEYGQISITPKDPLSLFQFAVTPAEDVVFADLIVVDEYDSDSVLRPFENKQ